LAKLTTISGADIEFQPGSVAAVTDHDVETGQAVTTLYGLGAGRVEIAETVEGFLTRIGVLQKFAKLTRPDGSPIWVNAQAVGLVRAPLPDEGPDSARAVVSIAGLHQAIRETPAEATEAIDAHGGDI
jgi:hypothetical protein